MNRMYIIFTFLVFAIVTSNAAVTDKRHFCDYNFQQAEKYKSIIYTEARLNHVDPILIAAFILHESEGNPWARGKNDDRGLMQVIGKNYPGCPDCLFDPATNIHVGTKLFKEIYNMKGGNLMVSISAYNTGPYRTDGWINQIYVDRVSEKYELIKNSEKCIF